MVTGTNKRTYIILTLLLMLVYSCNSDVIFSSFTPIKDKVWHLSDKIIFEVPVTDTINSNDVSFTIRTASSYPFRNIYLFVSTTSPDGRSIGDTLNYYLADEKGNWYGKGIGDIHELKLPYRTNVFFPLKGTYLINIRHGMRMEDLKGVYDIGVRIEKTSK